jgi:hypothetical protein
MTLVGVIARAAIPVSFQCGGPCLLYPSLLGEASDHLGQDAEYRAGIDFFARTARSLDFSLLGAGFTGT